METHLHPEYAETQQGKVAEQILRSCVHCGFCTATCPTYQELGDELDGPRGRIYQIKNVLEGEAPVRQTQQHLDRCLTCLNCMTTCPSGVDYQRLLEIGREIVEKKVKRPRQEQIKRWALRKILPYPTRFRGLLSLARVTGRLLPKRLQAKIPAMVAAQPVPQSAQHSRRVILHQGCVQPTLTPSVDAATVRVLNNVGIAVNVDQEHACCGAISQHLAAGEEARQFMRRKIDQWWPQIESGAEAIIVTASGCGAMVKDYGHLLADDPEYAEKAARVSALTRDLVELLSAEDLQPLKPHHPGRIAFHPPCTLQHGQNLQGRVEALLEATGFELSPVKDSHSCCGSAGTYTILQEDLSQRLLKKKISTVTAGAPRLIATANVGCQTHLQSATELPVVHWIELFDPETSGEPE